MYSSSGLSTDVFFPNKTNINTHCLFDYRPTCIQCR